MCHGACLYAAAGELGAEGGERCSLICARFTVDWRRDDKQAADEDALLSGAHSPVSSSPLSPWKSFN